MANFSGTINLLGFKGAKVFTNLDAQHPQMAWVCVPVPYNDIQLSQDGKYASARVFMAETNDKFRQACIQRKQQSGDDMTGYMPPSHQMEVSFTQEFRQRALEAARKRLLGEHPEWTRSPRRSNRRPGRTRLDPAARPAVPRGRERRPAVLSRLTARNISNISKFIK